MTGDKNSGAGQSTKSGGVDTDRQAQMQAVWERIEKRAAIESPKEPEQKKPSKAKKIILIVLIVIAVIVLVVAGICLFTDVDDNIIRNFKYSGTDITSQGQAITMVENGDYDRVMWWYNKQLESTDDKSEQARLYLELANVLSADSTSTPDNVDQERVNQAVDYALKSEELKPSVGSAVCLETLYQLLGDDNNAKKYGDMAQERISSGSDRPEGVVE